MIRHCLERLQLLNAVINIPVNATMASLLPRPQPPWSVWWIDCQCPGKCHDPSTLSFIACFFIFSLNSHARSGMRFSRVHALEAHLLLAWLSSSVIDAAANLMLLLSHFFSQYFSFFCRLPSYIQLSVLMTFFLYYVTCWMLSHYVISTLICIQVYASKPPCDIIQVPNFVHTVLMSVLTWCFVVVLKRFFCHILPWMHTLHCRAKCISDR